MSGVFSTVAGERLKETKLKEQLRKQQQRVEVVEKFSGLRIKNRLVPSAVLEDKFSDLRFTKIPDLRHDLHGRWATAGVLVEKTMKQAASGSSYSVWKLSDMSPTDYTITVFLFGQAHLDWHKEDPGSVWCITDGELREDTGGKSHQGSRPTIGCNEPRQLCKLGASPVFGRCKGMRKDGNDCTMHVNTSVSEYCAYHASAALKSLATERMALGPGRAPKFVRNGKTVMGAKGMGGRMNLPPNSNVARELQKQKLASGGVSRVGPSAYTDRSETQIRAAALKQQGNSMTGRGAALVTGGAVGGKRANPGLSHKYRDADNRTGRAASNALVGGRDNGVKKESSSRFGNTQRQGVMSKNDLLASKKARTGMDTVNGSKLKLDSGFGGGFGGARDEKVPGVTLRKVTKTQGTQGTSQNPAPPQKQKQFVMEMLEDDDFDCDLDTLDALQRAKTVAKALKSHDPNTTYHRRSTKSIHVDFKTAASVRPAPPPLPGLYASKDSNAQRDNDSNKVAQSAGLPTSNVTGVNKSTITPQPPPAPGSFGDVFGSIAAVNTDGASKYEASADDLETDRMMETLTSLEKQDALHTQITGTHCLTIKCSRCECGILFERQQPETCRMSTHRAQAHETKKRFFKCGNGGCHFRTQTLGKPFPAKGCPKCRCEDWDKCGLSAQAERVKSCAYGDLVGNKDGMLARGVEHDFSLKAGGAFCGGHLRASLT